MTITFISNVAASNPDLPQAERDDLLLGVSSGVDLFDISHPFSYRASGDASNGQLIYNLARNRADASMLLPNGATATQEGGGLEIVTAGQYAGVLMPENVQADLFAEQQYLICAYVKIPTTAEWPSGNLRFICDSTTPNDSIVQVYFSSTVGQVVVRRTTAAGAAEQRTYILDEAQRGKVAQIGVYRTATSWGFAINADDFSFDSNQAAGALSTFDWSARRLLIGAAVNTDNIRLYRGFTENLAVTERNPNDVLNADWLRIKDLGFFS